MTTTPLQRRAFAALVGAALLAGTAGAFAQETEAPVVAAPKILDALSKDIVLDQPGRPGARRRAAAIDLQVQFTFDSAQLMPQGKRQLDELAMALNDKALVGWGFLLAGHTDRVGDADYNLRLSHARAEAVKAYLEQAHGVAPQRLQTIGYGFSRLQDAAHPAAALNRRVEVRRVALVGAAPARPIGHDERLVPTPK